mmetsp:Transcript_2319/g.5771  ORF Transcript_2319/g.5771 Transcript_2319/m.5771 type:complete len:238 (-) Transcript_2319:344-1057(-)
MAEKTSPLVRSPSKFASLAPNNSHNTRSVVVSSLLMPRSTANSGATRPLHRPLATFAAPGPPPLETPPAACVGRTSCNKLRSHLQLLVKTSDRWYAAAAAASRGDANRAQRMRSSATRLVRRGPWRLPPGTPDSKEDKPSTTEERMEAPRDHCPCNSFSHTNTSSTSAKSISPSSEALSASAAATSGKRSAGSGSSRSTESAASLGTCNMARKLTSAATNASQRGASSGESSATVAS